MTKYYKVNNAEDFDWLMKCLEETTGVRWINGEKPTEFGHSCMKYNFSSDLIKLKDGKVVHAFLSKKPNNLIHVSDLRLEYEQNKALQEFDLIDRPSHYNQGKFEPIDVIEDWNLNYHAGNALKYISRYKHKENEVQDLKKAVWYLEREIKQLGED